MPASVKHVTSMTASVVAYRDVLCCVCGGLDLQEVIQNKHLHVCATTSVVLFDGYAQRKQHTFRFALCMQ